MGQEVMDCNSKVMVGVHQPHGTGDNSVSVSVGIICEGNLELVFKSYQACHRIWAGAIHPYLPVMIDGHETEPWVHRGVDNGDIQIVDGLDRLPVMD